MKLIGAKDSFVRAPFVVEGMFIGLVGSAIRWCFSISCTSPSSPTWRASSISSAVFWMFIPISQVFRILVPVSLLLGVGIGYVGSRLTLKKHLKV